MPPSRPRTLIPPPLPYALAAVGGWWLDRHVHTLPLPDGAVLSSVGWALVAAGLALFVWTLATFARHRTTFNPYGSARALCADGPFAFSRNPIYLGDWLILAGVAALISSAWPLLAAPAVWVTIRYAVIRHEEAHLEAQFGDAWRDYAARVRRWF